MTEIYETSSDGGKLRLTAQELDLMKSFLDAHDRGGFYLVYNAMTDSEEAGLQARIATFSGHVGGAAFAANRLGQEEIGPGTADGRYPGIYWLSQKVAESAYAGIKGSNETDAGLLEDLDFFDSARNAWINANVIDYFPGNLLDATVNAAKELGEAFVAAFWAEWGDPDEAEANAERVAASIDSALTRMSSGLERGSQLALVATLLYDRFEKQPASFSGGQTIEGPNGFQIHVDATGRVDGAFEDDALYKGLEV